MLAEPFVAFFVLLSLYLRSLKNNSMIYLSSMACGIALLFKQSAFISVLIVTIITITNAKSLSKVLRFTLGFFLPLVAFFVYLVATNTIDEAYNQIFVYNLIYYPKESLIKIITLAGPKFLETAPIFLLAFLAIIIWLRNLKKESYTAELIILFLAPIPLFFVRHYPHYWLQIAPFIAILAAKGLEHIFVIIPRVLKYVFYTTIITFIMVLTILKTVHTLRYTHPRHLAEISLSKFLEAEVHTGPIYAENGYISQYFLLNAIPLDKYIYLSEINDWSEDSQKQLLFKIKNCRPIIVWPADPTQAYAKKIQEYILANYQPIYSDDKLGVVVYK